MPNIEDIEVCLKKSAFEIFYQPQVDLSSHKLIGAEARVRYKDAQGYQMPSSFIPQLEKNDKIARLDLWALRQVCDRQKMWLQKHCTLIPVTVNFSAWTLCNPYNIYDITMVIREFDLPSHAILLALTSTTPCLSTLGLDKCLAHLQGQDIDLALSNFGAGATTLSLFSDISFRHLKLDRLFLKKTMESDRMRVILKALVRASKELGMYVICSGIDTFAETEMLISVDCDAGQGEFFYPPMQEKEFDLLCGDL